MGLSTTGSAERKSVSTELPFVSIKSSVSGFHRKGDEEQTLWDLLLLLVEGLSPGLVRGWIGKVTAAKVIYNVLLPIYRFMKIAQHDQRVLWCSSSSTSSGALYFSLTVICWLILLVVTLSFQSLWRSRDWDQLSRLCYWGSSVGLGALWRSLCELKMLEMSAR